MYNYLARNKVFMIYIPLVLYWIVLLIATSIPGTSVPSVGVSDKLAHFTAYTILTVLLTFTISFQNKIKYLKQKAFISTLVIVNLYAVLDEIHQHFIPGRSMEFLDLLADFLGSILGVLIVYIIKQNSRTGLAEDY